MFLQANGIKVQNQCGHLTMDGYVCWKSKKEGGFHQTATLGNMTESGYYTVQKNTIEKKHSGENPQPRKTTAEKSTLEKNTAEKSTV